MPWSVGIQHPRKARGAVLGILSIGKKNESIAIVTSGDYEKYFEYEGIRYHHILDPQTGYPAKGTLSVSVIAGTCEDADALATAAFVKGFVEGSRFLNELKIVEGLIIRETDGEEIEIRTTSGFPPLK